MRSARFFPAAAMPNTRSRPSRAACPSEGRVAHRCGRPAGSVLHRLEQRVRHGASETGRELSRPWRIERHRHRRDPAHGGARPPRLHDRGQSPRNARPASKLGAARAINYRTEDFVEIVKAETDGKGVDVILDMVGGDYVMRNVNALARGGRLVNIAYQKGAKVEVDFRIVQNRLLTPGATGLRGRPDSEKAQIRDAAQARGLAAVRCGPASPVTTAISPWPRPRPRTI